MSGYGSPGFSRRTVGVNGSPQSPQSPQQAALPGSPQFFNAGHVNSPVNGSPVGAPPTPGGSPFAGFPPHLMNFLEGGPADSREEFPSPEGSPDSYFSFEECGPMDYENAVPYTYQRPRAVSAPMEWRPALQQQEPMQWYPEERTQALEAMECSFTEPNRMSPGTAASGREPMQWQPEQYRDDAMEWSTAESTRAGAVAQRQRMMYANGGGPSTGYGSSPSRGYGVGPPRANGAGPSNRNIGGPSNGYGGSCRRRF